MNRHGIDGIGAMGMEGEAAGEPRGTVAVREEMGIRMGIKTRKKNNEIVIERNGNDKREETGA